MEKDQGLMGSGSGAMHTSPFPTAPPSYDEAIANNNAAPRPYPPPNSTPYPTIQGTAMPMPGSYAQPAPGIPMPMPMPVNVPHPQPPVQQYNPSPQYPPQPNVVPQSYAQPTQVQIIQQAVTYALGPNPVKMSCPTCHADIKTTTVSDHQASAHICCIILCLLGCCLCSCLPYCMNSFMSVHHSCPNCKAYIGTWKG